MAEDKKRKTAPAAPKTAKQPAGEEKRPTGLRIGAVVLWLLAVGAEVAAIYLLNLREETLVIVALVVDALFCIVGSLLWKRANRVRPCQSKSDFVCFIWNQMGVIACIVAFIPFGLYLLLKADKISPKMKKTIAVIAAVLFLGSVGASIDYNPPSAEDLEKAETAAVLEDPDFDGTVYWTRFGKSYHLDPDCFTLSRTKPENLFSGTLEEAFAANRTDPCDFCALSDVDTSGVEEPAAAPEEVPEEEMTDEVEEPAA